MDFDVLEGIIIYYGGYAFIYDGHMFQIASDFLRRRLNVLCSAYILIYGYVQWSSNISIGLLETCNLWLAMCDGYMLNWQMNPPDSIL